MAALPQACSKGRTTALLTSPSELQRDCKEENVGGSPLFPETVIPQQWDT